MGKPSRQSSKDTIQGPGIFSLLKPYSGIVTLLIIMALLGSGINMLIPKIIADPGSLDVTRALGSFVQARYLIYISRVSLSRPGYVPLF